MQIFVEPKLVYGKLRYYPKCQISSLICDIAESKTISSDVILILKKYGITIANALTGEEI